MTIKIVIFEPLTKLLNPIFKNMLKPKKILPSMLNNLHKRSLKKKDSKQFKVTSNPQINEFMKKIIDDLFSFYF